ncbi:MAG: TlpA family protein disulfide reductase [Tissierellia bacterium]|nr:TlpA family protein disulfide reductase [Tissierellia bacterium]
MKKYYLLLILVLAVSITIVGCSSETNKENAQVQDEVSKEENIVSPPEETSVEDSVPEIASGKLAPNFTLKNLKGEEVSLEDYRGKLVLVNFWATWCKYCDMEMPDLQRLDEENEDLVVLAVNVQEDKETVEAYIEKGGYEFEVVLDEEGEIATMYLVYGLPNSYFIDEEGILLGRVPGAMTYDQMVQVLDSIREGE